MKKILLNIVVAMAAFFSAAAQQAEHHISSNINAYYEVEQDTLWSFGTSGLFKRDLNGNIIKWYNRPNTPQLLSQVVRCMVRDNKGLLWLGTDTGVMTFNGKTWKNVPQVDSTATFSIGKDANGAIWAGTQKAIYAFDGTKWDRFEIPQSTFKRAIVFDKNNQIWISQGSSIYTYDGITWTKAAGYTGSVVYDMLKDNAGNIWIGHGLGVSRYDGTAWKNFTATELGASSTVRNVLKDSDGNIWAIGGTNLFKFENNKWTKKGLHGQAFAFGGSYDAKNKKIWVGGSSDLLSSYDINTDKALIQKSKNALKGYSFDLISSLEDEILVSSGEAISIYANKKWRSFANPLDSNQDWYASQTLKHPTKNEIWLTTDAGVYTYDKVNGFVQKHNKTDFSNIQIAADGTIWTNTFDSLYRLENNKFVSKNKEYFSTLAPKYINDILLSKKGELWVATDKGLYNIVTKKTYNIASSDFTREDIVAIFEQKNGKIWATSSSTSTIPTQMIVIGTDGKVEKKTSGKLFDTNYNMYPFFSAFEDSKNNLWIDVVEGLAKSNDDGKNWKVYNLENAPYLLSKDTYGMTEDKEGNLWLIHFEGITVIKKSTLLDEKTPIEIVEFQVFPNPTSDRAILSLDAKYINKSFSISNIEGKVIYSNTIQSTTTEINTSNWAKGVYFISIQNEQSINTKKLIVQ